MDFIKKHYEKLVLGVVLLAVAGVAIYLVLSVSQVKADLQTALEQAAGAKQKSLQPINLVTNEMELARVVKHVPVVLGDPDHYTFNPVTWARAANGRIEPTRGRADMGAAGLAYVESHDLYLEIGFSAVAGTPEPRDTSSASAETTRRLPNSGRPLLNPSLSVPKARTRSSSCSRSRAPRKIPPISFVNSFRLVNSSPSPRPRPFGKLRATRPIFGTKPTSRASTPSESATPSTCPAQSTRLLLSRKMSL